jgi:predicted ABC-type transport system involved in lysophospholipase L1 biosynthesis ATPase subunit
MKEAVVLENVIKTTADGLRAVNGASFAVGEHECVLLRGVPGSGKTALMRLIAGMDKPEDGKVFVLGRQLHEMSADERASFRNRSVGICLKEPCLMPDLTAIDNVILPLKIRGAPKSMREKAAMDQMGALGIAYAAHALPVQLKPYEAKLVALARAFVKKPPLLLLCDMTAGLSESQAERFDDVLRAALQYASAAVMLFTAGNWTLPADRRFVMEHGTIREELQ